MNSARAISAPFILGVALLWGSGNTAEGLRCSHFLSYVTKPIITGAGGDCTVGGTLRTWGTIPYVELANLAAIVVNT